MGDENSFSDVVSATNENITRLTRNLALTASTVISGGASQHTMAAPSAYHRAMTDVVSYRRRALASKIKDVSPRQALQDTLVQRIGGVRAPHIPDELLENIPKPRTTHSLFQTFEATAPSTHVSATPESASQALVIRKEMAASELMEIDEKIAELRSMRKLVFDRMAVAEREQSSDEPVLQHYYPSGEQIKKIGPPAHSADPVIMVDFNSPFGQLALTRGDSVEIHELSQDIDTVSLGVQDRVNCLLIRGADPVVVAGVGNSVNLWYPQQSIAPTFLRGHVGEVVAVDYDGESVVSSSCDETVREWDARIGKNTATIDMYEYGACRAVQHTQNALAAGTEDGIVRLFDLRSSTHRPQRELRGGHGGGITALHFSGLEMVSGSMDGSVRLWDLRSGQVAHTESYANSVTALSFDTTKIVASVKGEQAVRVYSRASDENRACATDYASITTMKYMNGYLVTGRETGSVEVWAI